MSEYTTPHLSMDYLVPEQAQKHVTLNEALRRLDGLVHLSVISASRTSPPPNPSNGDRYLIAANALADWQGKDGQIAIYEDTAWRLLAPQTGWHCWNEAAEQVLVYSRNKWQTPEAAALAGLRFAKTDALFDFSKPLPVLNIPSHSLFFGVTGRIVQNLTGATSWHLGVADGPTRFGTNLPVAADTLINGPANPPAVYWQRTSLLVSPVGGAFTGGQVRLCVFSLSLPVPAA